MSPLDWLVSDGELNSLVAGAQMAGFSRVSAMAHLGGATIGFLFWLWLKTPAEIVTSGKPP